MSVGTILVSRGDADSLVRAVQAFSRQLRRGDELLAAVPPWESEVRAALAGLAEPVGVVDVYLAGPIHGRNAGLAACSADVVAFSAPDAEVPGDWLERVRRHFRERPALGAVMGPVAAAAGVAIEPGCGLAVRRRLIDRFDPKCIRTQAAFEEYVAAAVRRKGCEVLCDPALAMAVRADDHAPDAARGPALVANASRLLRTLSGRTGGCCVSYPGVPCSAERRRYCAAGAGVSLPGCLPHPAVT